MISEGWIFVSLGDGSLKTFKNYSTLKKKNPITIIKILLKKKKGTWKQILISTQTTESYSPEKQ